MMRKFVRKQLWLFIFFVSLSGLTLFSYWQSESRAEAVMTPKQMMNEHSYSKMIESESIQSQRMIASADLDFNADTVLKVSAFCSDKLPKIYLKKSLATLQIEACLKEFEKSSTLQVTNLTNGYKGQVFKTGLKKFKTDFIQLNEGINQIQILFYTKDRQMLTQTLEITSGS